MSWLHLITQDTYTSTSSFFAIAWSGLILSQHKKERQPGFSWAALPSHYLIFFSRIRSEIYSTRVHNINIIFYFFLLDRV